MRNIKTVETPESMQLGRPITDFEPFSTTGLAPATDCVGTFAGARNDATGRGQAFQSKNNLSAHLTSAPTYCVEVYSSDSFTSAAMSKLCEQAGIKAVEVDPASELTPRDETNQPVLVLLHIQNFEKLPALVEKYRNSGALRIVFIGPENGTVEFEMALLNGCDEVWPKGRSWTLYMVMLKRAWHAANAMVMYQGSVSMGPLAIGRQKDSVIFRQKRVFLGEVYVALLLVLIAAHPRPVSRDDFLKSLGRSPDKYIEGSRIIDVMVTRLRQKLKSAGIVGIYVRSIRGVGYSISET